MEKCDVAIIGGGIAGASLAYFLKTHAKGAGLSVVLLEQEEALAYHATGRSAAEFVLGYNAPEVMALARIARPFFDQPPEGFAEVPLLIRRGGLIYAGAENADRLSEQFAREQAANPALEWLSADETLARMPFLSRDALGGAYFDPDYWDIEVDALMSGYLRGARKSGLEVRLKSAFQSARREQEGWRIETASGPLLARVMVNAAGGWADPVAIASGVPPKAITPMRRTAVLVDLPEGIEARSLPELNEIDDSFYFKPDGGRLFVSPSDATPCEPADVQPEEIDIAWAMHHLESHTTLSVKRVAKAWAGMRSFAPDALPVVGFEPGIDGFFWLAGQGGYGILSSPALGNLAAHLLLGETLPETFTTEGLDAERFSPARFV